MIYHFHHPKHTTSTVSRGLQSCLEPLLVEPRVLMHQLQLLPSKQSLSFHNPNNRNGEDSMQSMTNHPWNNLRKNMEEADKAYVHPLAKRSSYCLSSKSLEMCTESLGSETGSVVDSTSMDQSTRQVHQKQTKTRQENKKVRQSSFPPPLTSISGSQGVHVQTHREGGRLVIKAFSFSSSSTLFQTERKDGRLRLSLVKAGERERKNEVDDENQDKEIDSVDEDTAFKAHSLKNGCKIGRCNGDRRKTLPSLQCCVAIS